MMIKATKADLNIIEKISLLGGTTIYSGWVTAATILNVSIVLYTAGMNKKENEVNEEMWGIIILWVALVVYTLVQFT